MPARTERKMAMDGASYQSCILLLADGARADVFRTLVDDGRLPNIREHIVARGSLRDMTTAFTSTSGPAYVPFFTGLFPGTANVPGVRWFDKRRQRRVLNNSKYRFRDYCSADISFLERDMPRGTKSLFSLTRDPINVFGCVHTGLPDAGNLEYPLKQHLWVDCKASGDWCEADWQARRVLLESLDRAAQFRFAIFPGIDATSHGTWHGHDDVLAAYDRMDETVGAAARRLRELGTYDATLLAICSDHGHSPTDSHTDIAVFLEEELGLRTLAHPLEVRDPQAVVCVSGNAMAHVYLRGRGWHKPCGHDELVAMQPNVHARLLALDAVDLVMCRTAYGAVRIDSARGSALLREHGDGRQMKLTYEPLEGDPFGFGELPRSMTFEEALALTADSEYPDALVQVAQLFRSPRTGDIALSASPGHDLRERHESPVHTSSHGSLHRAHMQTPFAISHPIADRPLRTADVFPSLLDLLGIDLPADRTIDGASFVLSAAQLDAQQRQATVGI